MNRRTFRIHLIASLAVYAIGIGASPAGAMADADAGRAELTVDSVLERYEASLRAMRQFRLNMSGAMYFVGGQYKTEINFRNANWRCLRDGARWKVDCSDWEAYQIKGKSGELRGRHENLVTEAGEIDVWRNEAAEKDGQAQLGPLKINARLQGEAPPAYSDDEVSEHLGDCDRFALFPWPLALENGCFIFGYVGMDGISRLSNVLAHSGARIVDTSADDGAGHRCVLIEARGKFGRHQVWFDAVAGFLPRRVVVEKAGDDIYGTGTVASIAHENPDSRWPNLPVERVVVTVANVDIQQFGSDFATIAFVYTLTRVHPGGVSASERSEYRVADLALRPSYDPSKDFKLTATIPDGTPVFMRGAPQIAYEWRNGKVVKSLDQSAAAALRGQTFQTDGARGVIMLIMVGLAGAGLIGVVLLRRRARRGGGR